MKYKLIMFDMDGTLLPMEQDTFVKGYFYLLCKEVADKIDVSVAFMSRIERGNSKVNLKRLTQIAETLSVSPGYLLTGSNTATKDYLREDFRQVLDKCTPEQQRLIYAISELVSRTNFKEEEDDI